VTRNRRWIAGALLGLASALIAYRIYLACLSDETRIRRMVAAMESGFNEGRTGALVDRLAEKFTEEASGLGREEVRMFLARFFLTERLPKSHRLRYQVETAPGEVLVSLSETERDRGRLEVTARFFTRNDRDDSRSGSGAVLFSGELVKESGEWRILRAKAKLLEGRWPF
jgi:hypothetical protein